MIKERFSIRVGKEEVPVVAELNKNRGTLLKGNAVQFDKGTVICMGTGTLRLNGKLLPGVLKGGR